MQSHMQWCQQIFVGSEFTLNPQQVTQGCLENINTPERNCIQVGESPQASTRAHTNSHSQAQCLLIGKKWDFYYSAQLRPLSVLCKFPRNFAEIYSCTNSLKISWWKNLVVATVCLAKGPCFCLSTALTLLSLFQNTLTNLPLCSPSQGISRCQSAVLTVKSQWLKGLQKMPGNLWWCTAPFHSFVDNGVAWGRPVATENSPGLHGSRS